ncbi:MAG: nitroreductase family deazaflavin-dependent oxidoreductase [Acidimicrobiia bacterium]
MLTTTGRRSAKPHAVTLYAFDDGERLVVVGSYGGSTRDPDWVQNLRAAPDATIRRRRKELTVNAVEVDLGPERDRLWQLVCREFSLYETYQHRTKRLIPLFVLEPS